MSFRFHGKEFTFTQPDGTPFRVRGWGDQHYAVFESLDGYSMMRDPVTGFYQFALPTADGDELSPSGARVDLFDPTRLGLEKGVRVAAAASKAIGNSGFRLMVGSRRCEQRRKARKDRMRARLATGIASAPPERVTVGDYVGLCLLIDFSDDKASILQPEVDRFCNSVGYAGFGNNGSVYDYFMDNSRGLFRYKNVVTKYYRAKHPKSYYTNPKIAHGTRARQLIKEALDSLKASGFDFAQLTADSGGYVYALNVFYAGICPNNWSEGLWPHAWNLATPYDVGNGKQIYDYQFTHMGHELTLGTFCHENGHMVCDYPDLYDYGYESSGVGDYCLMCSGGDEKNPTQVSAYLKYASGWGSVITPILPKSKHALPAGVNEFSIHVRNGTEYFILENRAQIGRDTSLPGSGLAIWHVDHEGDNSNEQMRPDLHYELSLKQADGKYHLERLRGHRGDATDLFPLNGVDRFDSSTSPSSKWWDGTPSGLSITNIRVSGDTVEFDADTVDA